MAGEPCNAVVALALGNAVRCEAAPLGWRRGPVAAASGVKDLGQQPSRWFGDLIGGVDRPAVAPAAGVRAWRCQRVTVVAANVDAARDLAAVMTSTVAGSAPRSASSLRSSPSASRPS